MSDDLVIRIRYAETKDISELKKLDQWPSERVWENKISAAEVMIATCGKKICGILRFEVLWTTVPFLGLIHVIPEFQGRGISRMMLEFLRTELIKRGYAALLSSSQTDEPQPQKWHIHMGFHSNGIIENIADDGVGEIVYRVLLDECRFF